MEKKVETWRIISDIKNGLVSQIIEEVGDRTIDVREENVCVFAIEHHSNEGIWGTLETMSADGFSLGGDADYLEFPWKDMIVEDLAMVLDYLRTGNW